MKTMKAADEKCSKIKQIYENCFRTWYSNEFVQGKIADSPCQDEFVEYKSCVVSFMQGNAQVKDVNL